MCVIFPGGCVLSDVISLYCLIREGQRMMSSTSILSILSGLHRAAVKDTASGRLYFI